VDRARKAIDLGPDDVEDRCPVGLRWRGNAARPAKRWGAVRRTVLGFEDLEPAGEGQRFGVGLLKSGDEALGGGTLLVAMEQGADLISRRHLCEAAGRGERGISVG
jgi:hypothetical protein